jgi:hypothetical protein
MKSGAWFENVNNVTNATNVFLMQKLHYKGHFLAGFPTPFEVFLCETRQRFAVESI